MSLPTDYKDRKDLPLFDGTWGYFPDALTEVARVSFVGNKQHNEGEPLHWAREKSTDEVNSQMRHAVDHRCFKERYDKDGTRHLAKNAWRALAELQKDIETERDEQKMRVVCGAVGGGGSGGRESPLGGGGGASGDYSGGGGGGGIPVMGCGVIGCHIYGPHSHGIAGASNGIPHGYMT